VGLDRLMEIFDVIEIQNHSDGRGSAYPQIYPHSNTFDDDN